MAQVVIGGIVAGCATALMGLAFGLIYSVDRRFYVGQGAIFTLGAYAALLCHDRLASSLPLALVLGCTSAGVAGFLTDRQIYRRLRSRNASSLVFLMASLGLYIVIQNLISWGFGDDTRSFSGIDPAAARPLFGARVTQPQLWMVLATIAVFGGVNVLLRWSRYGMIHRATADNALLATSRGIAADRVVACSFACGSTIAGLAAILVSMDTNMTPTMGLHALVWGYVAMVIGGVGHANGALLGGLFLGFVRYLSAWHFGSQWEDVSSLGLLMLFLVLRPRGFLGDSGQRAP